MVASTKSEGERREKPEKEERGLTRPTLSPLGSWRRPNAGEDRPRPDAGEVYLDAPPWGRGRCRALQTGGEWKELMRTGGGRGREGERVVREI
uniref:Uncharacterized protein n=1 Tax=Oryza brachyantha TaxID=4533 RepID=J3MBU2_ORYBR